MARILDSRAADFAAAFEALLGTKREEAQDVDDAVAAIIADVRTRGDAAVIVAGGQESMSLAPHVASLRAGKKLGNIELVDTVMRDGLSDAFYGYPMGVTAENIVRQCGLTRENQDQFALRSQQRASLAAKEGRFAHEIVPVTIAGRKGSFASKHSPLWH